jgi:hypothetical protein
MIMNVPEDGNARPTRPLAIADIAIATSVILTAVMAVCVFVVGGRPGRAEAPRTVKQSQSTEDSAPQTLDDAIRMVRERDTELAKIADYRATFKKTERVENKTIEQSMALKIRHKPFSVYLRYLAGKEKGREVLYVEGANDNQLLVRERGLLASLAGTVKLKVDDPQVREENRYPITQIGLRGILDRSIANWKSEQTTDPKNIQVKFLANSKVESMNCEAIEVVRKQPGPKFPYSLTRVYFDKQSKLPIGAEQYGWPSANGDEAPLLERYSYADVKADVGLTDADFDPENADYGFKAARK